VQRKKGEKTAKWMGVGSSCALRCNCFKESYKQFRPVSCDSELRERGGGGGDREKAFGDFHAEREKKKKARGGLSS